MNQTDKNVKSWKTFLSSTAIVGLVVLVPLAILFLAAVEIHDLLESVAILAELNLPFPRIVNGMVFVLLSVIAVFTACFLTGLLLLAGPGKKFRVFVEKGIADKIPLLGLARKLTLSLTGAERKLVPVEADVYGSGARLLGFSVEELADGRYVVFVPTSPAITLGHTYVLPPERVTFLDASVATVVNALTQWGAGAQEIYGLNGVREGPDDSA
jgi:uncharacterized membrane protein